MEGCLLVLVSCELHTHILVFDSDEYLCLLSIYHIKLRYQDESVVLVLNDFNNACTGF
jgi:hypothetical protein